MDLNRLGQHVVAAALGIVIALLLYGLVAFVVTVLDIR